MRFAGHNLNTIPPLQEYSLKSVYPENVLPSMFHLIVTLYEVMNSVLQKSALFSKQQIVNKKDLFLIVIAIKN